MLSVPHPLRACGRSRSSCCSGWHGRMFEEGLGHVRVVPKHGSPAPLTNELYVNATAAIKMRWDERRYDPKFPEQIKARLGYMRSTASKPSRTS